MKRLVFVALIAGVWLSTAFAQHVGSECTDMAQLETNKALFHQVAEGLFVEKNLDIIDQFYAQDYVHHGGGRDAVVRELGITHAEYTKRFFSGFLKAFPDLEIEIEHVYAEGDKVTAFVRWTGTHQGEFMGKPATGKHVTLHTAEIFRVEDGKFVEHWDVVDNSGMSVIFEPEVGIVGSE